MTGWWRGVTREELRQILVRAAAGGLLVVTLLALAHWAREPSDTGDEDGPGPLACDRIPVFADGRQSGTVCRDRAGRHTLLPLGNDWLPVLFSETPEQRQRTRALLLDLANERRTRAAREALLQDRHFELWGIPPSVGVVARRLLDEQRHDCHDAIDDQPLASALPARPSQPKAVRAIQEHLRCEGWLSSRARATRFDFETRQALKWFQRRHMLVAHGLLDDETRQLLAEDSRELDFRSLLRVLRERVGDAAGLIEDGSAKGQRGQVLGRTLDSQEFREGLTRAAATPVKGTAASDRLSPATEAAARALGWTSPAAARAWFVARAQPPAVVAVRLPERPAYHARHMELRAVIDRGDVWLTSPEDGRIKKARRPTLTLYTRTPGGDEIALVRWPTTIGGWQTHESEDGTLSLRYMGSPTGKGVWRDVLAAPAWRPPPGTPTDDLVVTEGKQWRPAIETIGPGYRAAYGLVAILHHRVSTTGPALVDEGIRTHGSPNYLSIARGVSHGCHRLYNHLAVRLAGFLLQHRDHTRHGLIRDRYQLTVTWQEEEQKLVSDHRGYRYELTPPVPIEVLPGTVRGSRQAVAEPIVLQEPEQEMPMGN